jgi:hypothetical protein
MRTFKSTLGVTALLLALALAGCDGNNKDDDDDGDGGGSKDKTAPTILSTSPIDAATNVPTNVSVVARFSEAMDATTMISANFTLTGPGVTPVAGAVTYNATTHAATFVPSALLDASTAFTATVTTGAKDVAGNALATAYTWNFLTGTSADTTPPTVDSTSPADGAVDVALNAAVIATFSEAMNGFTITGSNFLLTGPLTNAVPGTVSYDTTNSAATFLPASLLAANTLFTATITVDVEDLAGNALATEYTWTFTSGNAADTTPPTVTFVSPTHLATSVPIDQNVTALFDEPMDTMTLNTTTFTLTENGSAAVAAVVTSNGTQMTLNPAANLLPNTLYTAVITVGVTDVAGNPLAAQYEWDFTTGTATDTNPPTVISTNPADTDTDVPLNQIVTAIFSEQMNSSTVNGASFTLLNGAVSVAGTVACPGTTATFTPTAALVASTTYTATITTAVTDLVGNPMAVEAVWSFTTGTSSAQGPAPVVLGTAINFVILAKSGVSTTGTTAVTGNVGLSPAAGSFLTGFSETMDASNEFSTSAVVTGQVFAADYAPPTPTNLTTAILDMQTAYADAAGRTLPDFTELGAGDINGLTLVPGLYKWGTGVSMSTGVTISGGANDIWIFQVAQDLTIGNGAIVTLTGGAQAKNIVWQVTGQASLGTTSDFKGIILCQTQIVCSTGAVVLGRALAQTAVTLDATSITAP